MRLDHLLSKDNAIRAYGTLHIRITLFSFEGFIPSDVVL